MEGVTGVAGEADPVRLASNINQAIRDLELTIHATIDMLGALPYSGRIPWLDKPVDPMILAVHDLPALVSMLQETSTNCLNAPFAPPRSAQYAANQIHNLLLHLNQPLRRIWGTDRPLKEGEGVSHVRRLRALVRLRAAAPDFIGYVERLEKSITRLRHIVTDSVTHKLLREARQTFEELAGYSDREHPANHALPPNTDPTLFDAVVIRTSNSQEPKYYPARGKMDGGADCNLTNMQLLKRMELEHDVEKVEDHPCYLMAGGMTFEPKYKIRLCWHTATARKVLETEFYVTDDEPFDLLFGNGFMREHGGVIGRRPGYVGLLVRHETKEQRRLHSQTAAENRANALAELSKMNSLVVPNVFRSSSATVGNTGDAAIYSSRHAVSNNLTQRVDRANNDRSVALAEDPQACAGASPSSGEHSRVQELDDDDVNDAISAKPACKRFEPVDANRVVTLRPLDTGTMRPEQPPEHDVVASAARKKSATDAVADESPSASTALPSQAQEAGKRKQDVAPRRSSKPTTHAKGVTVQAAFAGWWARLRTRRKA